MEVWTDKEAYEVGDTMTFFYRANGNLYVTVIAVGTSGQMQVIFPNKFSSDDRIAADSVYSVPQEDAEYAIYVQGPPGVERIKVIATERPLAILAGEEAERFSRSVQELDVRTAQAIERISKRLAEEHWAHAYMDVQIIGGKSEGRGSGRPREIKPKSPEKPIDIIGVPGAKLERPADQEPGVSVVPIPKGNTESETGQQEDVAP